MKKLLIATVFVVLAAVTETPNDHMLSNTGDMSQADAYFLAWAQAEAEGLLFEDPKSRGPLSDVYLDQFSAEADFNISL